MLAVRRSQLGLIQPLDDREARRIDEADVVGGVAGDYPRQRAWSWLVDADTV